MDIQYGVLLLLIGLPVTFLVFALIVWAEQTPKKAEPMSSVEKSIRDLFNI